MDRVSFVWTELLEGQWKSTFQVSADRMESTMYIKVNRTDVNNTIADISLMLPQILGSNSTRIVPGEIQGHGGRGPSVGFLERRTPAKHPYYPWMRATEVGIEGIGKIHAADDIGVGKAGTLTHWVLRIKFEVLSYAIKEDSNTTAEYERYTEWEPLKPSIENLVRKDRSWYYVNESPMNVFFAPEGSIPLRLPKNKLVVWWRRVPLNFVLRSGVFAANITNGVGKVNARPFPYVVVRPPVLGEIEYKFIPGTLLMLSPEYVVKPDVVSTSQQNGNNFAQYFDKTCDIKFEFLYINPPSEDTSTIDLRGCGGDANTLIRGHNLVPVPRPIVADPNRRLPVGGSWFTISNEAVVPAAVQMGPPAPKMQGIVRSDANLIYQYYDFENLFKYGG